MVGIAAGAVTVAMTVGLRLAIVVPVRMRMAGPMVVPRHLAIQGHGDGQRSGTWCVVLNEIALSIS